MHGYIRFWHYPVRFCKFCAKLGEFKSSRGTVSATKCHPHPHPHTHTHHTPHTTHHAPRTTHHTPHTTQHTPHTHTHFITAEQKANVMRSQLHTVASCHSVMCDVLIVELFSLRCIEYIVAHYLTRSCWWITSDFQEIESAHALVASLKICAFPAIHCKMAIPDSK